MKKVNWEKYYKLPLSYDGYNYAWGKDSSMALMFESDVKEKDAEKIVSVINGKSDKTIEDIRLKDGEFFIKDTYIFCVRGWGNLTGCGGHNLPFDEAAKIQDSFADYILDKLKNNGRS